MSVIFTAYKHLEARTILSYYLLIISSRTTHISGIKNCLWWWYIKHWFKADKKQSYMIIAILGVSSLFIWHSMQILFILFVARVQIFIYSTICTSSNRFHKINYTFILTRNSYSTSNCICFMVWRSIHFSKLTNSHTNN